MAQRHIQLFRNGTVSYEATRTTHQDVVDYLMGAGSPLTDLTVKDGELVLYRYQLTENGDIHTIVLAVSFPEGGTKTFEVVANYDHLKNLITDLDNTVTDSNTNNDITVTVNQEDGLLKSVEVSDTLKAIAHTGNASDVAIADDGEIITATTVEGALAEIAKEIDDMDSSLLTTNASQTNKLIKLGYTQEDGVITSLTSDETALEARLKALEDNTITGENAIVVTPDTTTGNNTVSLTIANNDKVLTQSDAGLLVNLGLTWDDNTDNKITLTGKDGVEIASIDASKFIKDGMLEDVELVNVVKAEDGTITINGTAVADGESTTGITESGKYFKFTWNTYEYNESGEATKTTKVEYLNVESLVDSYTAGNEWININQTTNTISHKTVDGLDSTNTHGITADVTVDSTTTKTFNVPSLKVDAAGHVTSVDEKTVTITLPASIDTAVQTVTSNEQLNTTNKFVAVHATKTGTDVELTSELKIQDIATAAAANGETPSVNGLATALNVKEYVTANSTTVSGYTKTTGEGDSAVSTVVTEVEETTNENGSTNYQVKLPEIPVTTANTTNTMADETATHTYMTGIETDGFGRVTKVITETMTEDIDAGSY